MSSLSDIVLKVSQERSSEDTQAGVADIIEFVESSWGLSTKLYPVQRIILKAFYGIPLDDTTPNIRISDWQQDVWENLTEAGYLRKLFKEGRSNVGEILPGKQYTELVLSIGRRSGKTFMSACCVAYEVYKLISKGTPQKYYGLKDTSEIGIVSVATATPQAGLLFNEAAGHFAKCAFFAPYTASSTLSHIKFQTANDIELFGRYKDDQTAKATIKVTFASCIAKGLRGPGNMMIILDELAHFNDVGQSDAKNVYDAITPSVATFSPKDPNDSTKPIGDVEGRKISISSPLGRQGFFFNLFQLGFRGGKASIGKLCIQAPTWEVNPTLPANYYAAEYASDPAKFFTEFGAEFTNSTRGWLEREGSDLLACVDPRARPKTQATPRVPHFAGIDLGLVNDGTAVAIGHLDDKQRIVLDFLEVIKAGEGKYVDSERLEFDEVAEWVYQLSRRFFISEGFFDQWSGIPFEQALIKKGLRQFHAEHMTKNKNSDIYRNFKDMIWDQRLVLYDHPIEEGQAHCAYIQELMDLQATFHSRYITEVEAPPGKHDDRSDALARMIWLASQNLGKAAYIVKGSNRGAFDQTLKGPIISKRGRKTGRTGSSPERQISAMSRRRL